jgi:hypothetical protein
VLDGDVARCADGDRDGWTLNGVLGRLGIGCESRVARNVLGREAGCEGGCEGGKAGGGRYKLATAEEAAEDADNRLPSACLSSLALRALLSISSCPTSLSSSISDGTLPALSKSRTYDKHSSASRLLASSPSSDCKSESTASPTALPIFFCKARRSPISRSSSKRERCSHGDLASCGVGAALWCLVSGGGSVILWYGNAIDSGGVRLSAVGKSGKLR